MEAHSEPLEPAESTERDTTDEWRISPARQPATVAELEGRIDVALATAQSAERAALEIGAAGLEAAEQARRAAALAERASASAARAAESARDASVISIHSAPSVLAADAPVGSIEPVGAAADAPVGTIEPAEAPVGASDNPVGTAEAATGAAEPTPSAEAEASAPAPAPSPLDPLLATPAAHGAAPRRLDPDPFEDRITAFRLRAEKVMIRLQKIEAGAPPHEPTEIIRLS